MDEYIEWLGHRIAQLDRETIKPGDIVREAIAVYIEAGSGVERLNNIRSAAKVAIEIALQDIGTDRLEVETGLCYITAQSARVIYDAKALDELASSDPGIQAALAPYRRESVLRGALVVRSRQDKAEP